MATIPADLTTFLATHRDSREYRRGLAVKLTFLGYTYAAISTMLDVTPGFISQAKQAYLTDGTDGLLLAYKGMRPLLSADERAAVIAWLKAEDSWSVERLQAHIETTYAVVFQSRQSYYALLAAAGMTYKKTQAIHPKHDSAQVAIKKKRSTTS